MTIQIGKGWDYELIKSQAKAEIDKKAEFARGLWLTPILGQEYVYAQKLREAETWKETSPESSEGFPFLEQEALAKGMTMDSVAEFIIIANRASNRRMAAIEAARFTAKMAIDNAPNSISAISSVVNDTVFPHFGLLSGEEET